MPLFEGTGVRVLCGLAGAVLVLGAGVARGSELLLIGFDGRDVHYSFHDRERAAAFASANGAVDEPAPPTPC